MSETTITLSTDNATVKALTNVLRYAEKTAVHWSTYVAENGVTKDNVADHARALAVATWPNDEPVQKVDGERTRFGNAVQLAGYHLRKHVAAGDSTPSTALLTSAGKKADLDDVIAAWHAAQG